jgi:hypothetical protein
LTLPIGGHRLYPMATRKKNAAAVAPSKLAAKGRQKKPAPEQELGMAGHIADNDFEGWAIGEYARNAATAVLEEHLLACGCCMEWAESMREYVWGMQGALQRLIGPERSRR